MSVSNSELIVAKCTTSNCKRIESRGSGINVCKGWIDPTYNWSKGQCEYITDEEVPDKISNREYQALLAKVRMRKDYRAGLGGLSK